MAEADLPPATTDLELMIYEVPPSLPASIIPALFQAEDMVTRFDERARVDELAAGWLSRLLFHQVCACEYGDGVLIHLDELVDLDGGLGTTVPHVELTAAVEVLRVWRRAGKLGARELLLREPPGEDRSAAIGPIEPDDGESEIVASRRQRLQEWRRVLTATNALPPLLAAVVAWDAWLLLEPELHGAWRGGLLAALVLRSRGKTRHALLPTDIGRRASRFQWAARLPQEERLAGLLQWIYGAADRATKELQTLRLSSSALQAKLNGRRRNSRLGAVITLFLSRPFITVPMLVKELKCSRQGALDLIGQLGSLPRELTGRRRFRAWSI